MGRSCPMGRSVSGMRQRTAIYVDKILKGTQRADLPVEPVHAV